MEDVYGTVSRIYEERRKRSRSIDRMRHEEVYAKIPRIEEINKIFTQNSLEMARLAITLNKDDLEQKLESYRVQTEELNREKTRLLTENGYPENYLEPVYSCPICKDTGIDGMKKCSCFNKTVIRQNYISSGVKDILMKENFDTFSLDIYPDEPFSGQRRTPYENAAYTLKKVKEAISKCPDKPCNLVFSGKSGVGKTFFCNCTAKALLDKGLSLHYTSAFKMFNDISQQHFNRNSENVDIEMILDSDLLVIDDLGAEIINSVSKAYLVDIIDQRIRRGRSTVISTNFSIDEIFNEYTERVGSRFAQHYIFLPLYCKDLRMYGNNSK